MPSTCDNIDHFYCENCVPRGCSCNAELKEGIEYDSKEAEDPKNYVEKLDEKGRKWPCCEYFWEKNEYEEEQRIDYTTCFLNKSDLENGK